MAFFYKETINTRAKYAYLQYKSKQKSREIDIDVENRDICHWPTLLS
jgi:hypothetical protein